MQHFLAMVEAHGIHLEHGGGQCNVLVHGQALGRFESLSSATEWLAFVMDGGDHGRMAGSA